VTTKKLPHDDVPDEFTPWIVLAAGEGAQDFATEEEAKEAAKEQAEQIPNLVLAVYRLAYFVSARVAKPAVFLPKERS
jgi:hypothetical protein